MKNLEDKALNSLHDSYIIGINIDHLSSIVTLKMRLDDAITSLVFHGATRFLLTEMLIQNIVYDIVELAPGSEAYLSAKANFDKTYWLVENPGSRIVSITASLGAEIMIEFRDVEVKAESA
jgi:hypothetical protein